MAGSEADLFPSQGRSNVPGKQTFHLAVTLRLECRGVGEG